MTAAGPKYSAVSPARKETNELAVGMREHPTWHRQQPPSLEVSTKCRLFFLFFFLSCESCDVARVAG